MCVCVPFDLLGAFHFWLVSGQIGSELQPQIAGGIFEQNDIDVLIILLPAKNFEACLYSALVDVCSGDK